MASGSGVLASMDPASEALLIQMQLADLDEIHASSKGKSREGELSDFELALQMQQESLETASTVLSDRRMTESIAQAVLADGASILENMAAEEAACEDRALARRTSGLGAPIERPAENEPEQGHSLDDEILAKLSAMYVADMSLASGLHAEDDAVEAESSGWASGRVRSEPLNRRCESCREEKAFYDILRVPCGHEYCRDCVQELIRRSLKDEAYFPPRCCRQRFHIQSLRPLLPGQLTKEYEVKRIEFETPNRTYCHVQACSAFLTPLAAGSDETIACLACSSETCVICKGAAHAGDCPQDTGVQQLLEIAGNNQWQRCFSCRRVVELNHGCNHISCRCGAQFCYVCGQQWRLCDCEHWEEDRLYARAAQIHDRNRVAEAEPAPVPEAVPGPEDFDGEAEPAVPQPAPRIPVALPLADFDGEGSDNEEPAAPQVPQPGRLPSPTPAVVNGVEVTGGAGNALTAAIERIAANLRANHDCDHERWRFMAGQHRCEECSHVLPHYIFVCRRCEIMACWRCRKHRL